MILNTTSTIFRLVTSAAVAVDVIVKYHDHNAAAVPQTFVKDPQHTAIVTATTTTCCAAPASGVDREIERISICARGGACNVRPEIFDGSVAFQCCGGASGIVLAQGDTLMYSGDWRVIDANGATKQLTTNIAIQGHVLKDNGTTRNQRANLNTVSNGAMIFTAVDDSGNDETELQVRPTGRGTDNTDGAAITIGNTDSLDLITSTTAITSFVFTNDFSGRICRIRFNTIRTLTHNATSLIILQGGASITTAVGDACEVESLGGGNVRIRNYERASAQPLVMPAASDTVSGVMEMAIQSEQETGTDVVRAVSPGRQQFHPSACKCWGFTTGAGTPVLNAQAFNMTSITDSGVGILTVTINVDFSSASYVAHGSVTQNAASSCQIINARTKAAGSVLFDIDDNAGTAADPTVGWDWALFGDQ